MQKRVQDKKAKKQCYFCMNNMESVDYKEVHILRRFISSYMKIAPRRRSGLCSYHQRKVSVRVKRARQAGLMAYMPK